MLVESSAKALKEAKIDVAQEKKNMIARTKDIKTLNDTTFFLWVRAIVGTSSTKLTEFNLLFSAFVQEFLFTSGGPSTSSFSFATESVNDSFPLALHLIAKNSKWATPWSTFSAHAPRVPRKPTPTRPMATKSLTACLAAITIWSQAALY